MPARSVATDPLPAGRPGVPEVAGAPAGGAVSGNWQQATHGGFDASDRDQDNRAPYYFSSDPFSGAWYRTDASATAGESQAKKVFRATAPKLSVRDRGMQQQRNLQLLRVYLSAQLHNSRAFCTAANVSLHLAGCFDADLSARFERVQETVERRLCQELQLDGRDRLIPASAIDSTARLASSAVKRYVYRMQLDYERAMVEQMRQGACTEGCDDVPEDETPGGYIDRFVLAASDPDVKQQLSTRQMVTIVSGGFHTAVAALWAGRRASPDLLRISNSGDHDLLFRRLADEAPLLDDDVRFGP
ncbi:hypothetical protein MNEG_12004 [Monoraphidium neglectum]|uniref:Uncharacterized protein n=1 Tax=Monoraphidium neglectum TaxID=145388 RepID=A0A0D2LWW7_9CHLO|nr:hypothetical protein MNEG_12004 [Monoraphidium neglectum]KIY95959.1 hypothetical protein MNEG_12004 [Monoraphidium neglectum]|eukprot:XP_013894979.1 hypothetical protein MNEG_12004 [Monoraphidium neglectum]